mmetsp:Transcript_95832/g.280122  ORF Transcript_95832/g.280122 Transcript_95832/m.280122 type:complete len:949 (+) Transcript_95832:137-2983(+)
MSGQRGSSSLGEASEGLSQDVEMQPNWKAMFAYHFLTSLVADAAVCGASILLWSSLGYGGEVYAKLSEHEWYSMPLMACCFLIVCVLYLVDFFWPPHLPQVLVLYDGDRFVGRSILGLATVLFVAACLLSTSDFVSMPVLISIIVCPLAVFGAHRIYDPFKPEELKKRKSEIVKSDNVKDKILLLKRITGEEVNVMMYYKACQTTFMLSFVLNLLVFLIFTVGLGDSLTTMTADLTIQASDAIYMQWSVPLVMSIGNFVFGLFAAMRVFVQRTYNRTDTYKNRIIADMLNSTMIREMTDHKLELLRRARHSNVGELEQGEEQLTQKRQQYLDQHTMMATQLSGIVKGVACVFMVLLGVCYCARQMLYASTHIASMVAGTMCIFFISFCIFTYVSLFRVVKAMGKWIKELPAWQTLQACLRNAWIQSIFLWLLIPILPGFILLSLMNQRIRRLRGIYQKVESIGQNSLTPIGEGKEGEEAAEEEAADEPPKEAPSTQPETTPPQALLLTPRVQKRLDQMAKMDWLAIIPKLYTLSLAYICSQICPPLLNVGLSALNQALASAGLHFSLILLAIFVVGIICFLLPTVPGAVIYLFGGLVSSGNCPPVGTEQGFWTGAACSVALGLVMKLVGCAIQQVIIGGLLGKSVSVRQTCGLHKTTMRCFEKVLRQKGYTAGKVAILCGGPDWPVSVIAGILGLPLWEMLLGTLPIIFFIAPFGLSGSLYLKKGQGGMWDSSAQLMIVCAFMVTMVLWAVAGWAGQQTLEKYRDELTRPLAQNVDLAWLDYRDDFVKGKLQITFSQVPMSVRVLWILGVLAQNLVCFSFQFGTSYLVGNFQPSDNIDTLEFVAGWNVEDGLVTYQCIALLAIYVFAWFFYVPFRMWKRTATGEPRKAAFKEIDATEAEWKDEYLKMCAAEAAKAERAKEEPAMEPSQEPQEEAKAVTADTPDPEPRL